VLLAEPQRLARFEPLSASAFGLEAVASWRLQRAGVLHGLGIWIDLQLADGVRFSNRPTGRSAGWNQRFLPLSERVDLPAGASVEAAIRTLGPSEREPLWWNWRVRAGGVEQEMDTFRGQPLTSTGIQRARLDRRPVRGDRGEVRRAILDLMDGSRTLAEIVGALRERFPELLDDGRAAMRLVAEEVEPGSLPGHGHGHDLPPHGAPSESATPVAPPPSEKHPPPSEKGG
jgi:protein arginine N-methyltransferase 1